MTPSSLSFGPISIPFLSRSPLRRRPFLLGRTTSTSTSTPTSVSPSPSYSSSPFLASAGIHSADALGHFLLTAADRLGSSLHDASRPASVALADIAHTLQRLVSALQSLSVAVFILAIALVSNFCFFFSRLEFLNL
eukprot:gb/GECH01005174.1/.p1 GENE.gb/GECH01005174.1/~~gb/GECH01005174.1/.p1  ORF type:complete len:136 (+),score=10.06 gb/GECH01005174.1/:1-408(+)